MAKIRDLNPFKYRKVCEFKNRFESVLYSEFLNLVLNALAIYNTDGTQMNFEVENFVKKSLIEGGSVGYDRLVDAWAWVYGEGVNIHGNPTHLTFHYLNGKTWQRDAYYLPTEAGAYRILALPDGLSLAQIIIDAVRVITTCDEAIMQNIEAVKTPYIVKVKDDNLRLSIKQAIEQKQSGQPVVVVSDDLGDSLQSIDINVEFIADKIEFIKTQYRDRLLNKLGMMSANTEKRERVQVGEVNATLGQCVDYIYLIIDTFNNQMVSYGLPFEMKLNNVLEELYTSDVEGESNDEEQY